ncbi:hypothetical protein LI328DRAFT_160970 [Trichoderma asperelloides]|nr:hypothetical protein LI328DRAFT_160970 [Trichoderma asperelloides]
MALFAALCILWGKLMDSTGLRLVLGSRIVASTDVCNSSSLVPSPPAVNWQAGPRRVCDGNFTLGTTTLSPLNLDLDIIGGTSNRTKQPVRGGSYCHISTAMYIPPFCRR